MLVLGVVLFPFLITSFVSFSSLVKLEFTDHNSEWIADGGPQGFFWKPPYAGLWRTWRSGYASNVLLWKWLFVTPTWVRSDQRARRLLTRFRVCVAAWNVGMVGGIVAVFLGVLRFP
jgi:hypothetical protein